MTTSRIDRYVPLAQKFSAHVVLFHESVAAIVGLHVTDLKVLRLLGQEPLTPSQIAEQTGLTGAAVTALVDRLVAADYVTRERDEEDRRRVTVRIIPARVRRIDRLYDEQRDQMAKILSHYDASEFALVLGFLEKTTKLLTEQTQKLRERAKAPRA